MGKGQQKSAEEQMKLQSQMATQQANVANRSLDIGEKLLNAATPAREAAQNYYSSVVSGSMPNLTRAVAPQLNAATQQFNVARKNIMNMAPGGARETAMRDVAIGEAGAKTNIYSGGVQEALARLAAMGWGGTQSGIGAYGQAGSMFGGAGSQYGSTAGNYMNLAQQKMQGWEAAGQGIGMLAAMI